jgi:uncharacterized membrane protein
MNMTKFIIATIASFVVMFLLGGLVHMKLLHEFYLAHMTAPCNIDRAEPMLLYIALGVLLLALIMSYMYPKGVESSNKVMEGFKFGAIIGILWCIPLDLIMYGSTEMFSRTLILVDAGTAIVIQGIGGIVIAYCYGNTVPVKNA